MKLTKDYFKDQLRKGVDPETMADEIATMLNEAQDEYNDETTKEANKSKALAHIVEDITDYLATYYDVDITDKLKDTDVSELSETLDAVMAFVANADTINLKVLEPKDKKTEVNKPKNYHDHLLDFILNNNWI